MIRVLAQLGIDKMPKNIVVLDNASGASVFYNHKLLGRLHAPDSEDEIYGIYGDHETVAS